MHGSRCHTQDYDASFFETSIRLLGGLLGAFNLSFEPVLLNKAAELGERLVQAFDAPGGLPWSVVNLKTYVMCGECVANIASRMVRSWRHRRPRQ